MISFENFGDLLKLDIGAFEPKATSIEVPTGDIEADMVEIKRYYAQYKGRNADQFTHE